MAKVKQKTKKEIVQKNEIVHAEPKKQHHIKGLLITNIILSALLLIGGFATFLVIYYLIEIGAIIGGFFGLILGFLLCLPVGAILIGWVSVTIAATTRADALQKESIANFRIIYIILTVLVVITTGTNFSMIFLPTNDLTTVLSEIIVAVHAVSLILSIIFASVYLTRRK